ncbi:hypothetical protein AB0C11_10750 [Streptomyces sp. NPDC039016]|uniref:hypothetical protein n=1 Tax=unclassified Streptomyces TaxID=2593676 RepID=UPI0011AF6DC4|nr:hypothetical protein [Streptomyces sp. CB02959]
MANIYRKSEPETREVEVFGLDLHEEDREALRADPDKFIRELLEPEIQKVNGVSLDVELTNSLANGGPFASYIVHHTVSGEFASDVEVTRREE